MGSHEEGQQLGPAHQQLGEGEIRNGRGCVGGKTIKFFFLPSGSFYVLELKTVPLSTTVSPINV